MRILRKILRAWRLKVHKGWKKIHRSGYDVECVGCGETRTKYHLSSHMHVEWWETTKDGDGSCGNIAPLRPRWGY